MFKEYVAVATEYAPVPVLHDNLNLIVRIFYRKELQPFKTLTSFKTQKIQSALLIEVVRVAQP